jgi:hypothetical protein
MPQVRTRKDALGSNRITSHLKLYYPQVLEWFDEIGSKIAAEFLERWPIFLFLAFLPPRAARLSPQRRPPDSARPFPYVKGQVAGEERPSPSPSCGLDKQPDSLNHESAFGLFWRSYAQVVHCNRRKQRCLTKVKDSELRPHILVLPRKNLGNYRARRQSGFNTDPLCSKPAI